MNLLFLIITLIVNLLFSSLLIWIFTEGIKLGKQLQQNGTNLSILPEKKEKTTKLTKEEKAKINEHIERTQKIWNNINNYDGSESSQEEVK